MNHVYGPVPSRRLGLSLGVDIVPYKICTLNCIYCQLGNTSQKSIDRKPYADKSEILKEVKVYLSNRPKIDFITFAGSGEPTLNSDIGILIKEIKELTSIPIVILTNGTLLYREDVQEDLLDADIVIPSLDAASQEIFERINRPHNSLKIETFISGLKRFRELYRGKIWLEVMLVKGVNDSKAELSRMKIAISEINPDKVHLNTVVRPPSEIYAEPLSHTEMIDIKNFFGEGCEIIAESSKHSAGTFRDVEESIIRMAKRRPVTIIDIADVIGISGTNAEKMIEGLKSRGKLKEVFHKGEKYYHS
jgi:Fe-S oxidoreductases